MICKRLDAAPVTEPQPVRFVVLTGLSGAGKSQAIRALEDVGCFCIDNPPTTLIQRLAELTLPARSGGCVQCGSFSKPAMSRWFADSARLDARIRSPLTN